MADRPVPGDPAAPERPSALPPRPGDVWRDLDRRGGPIFLVVEVDPPHSNPGRAQVINTDGKRPRPVLLSRFRHCDGYRTGYALVSRDGIPAVEGVPRA